MIENATCLKCGYSLRGLPSAGVCPECGSSFDVADGSTYRVPKRPWWHAWSQPPTRSRVWLVAGVTLLHLAASTNPAGLLGFIFLQLASIALVFVFSYVIPIVLVADYLIGLAALVVRCACVSGEAEAEANRSETSGETWRWAVLPICALLAASVYFTRWPLKARFSLSHAAMEQEAKKILSATSKPANPTDFSIAHVAIDRWIGLYRVSQAKVDTQYRTVEFILDGNAFIWWGFMYDPNQVRTAPDGMTVAPLWFGYVDAK